MAHQRSLLTAAVLFFGNGSLGLSDLNPKITFLDKNGHAYLKWKEESTFSIALLCLWLR